jgi:hypothetical protein
MAKTTKLNHTETKVKPDSMDLEKGVSHIIVEIIEYVPNSVVINR